MRRVGPVAAVVLALVLLGPVAAQDASPAAAGREEVLFAAAVDAALLAPAAGQAVLGHAVDEPGWRLEQQFPFTSAIFVHVVAGAFTLRSDGPMVVLQAPAGTPTAGEAVAPGAEATVRAGETIVFLSSARTEQRNDGAVPTDRYWLMVVGAAPSLNEVTGMSADAFVGGIDPSLWQAPPSGPVTVTLRRVAAGQASAAQPGTQQLVGMVGGAAPGELVATFAPGALPDAAPVDLTGGGTPGPAVAATPAASPAEGQDMGATPAAGTPTP